MDSDGIEPADGAVDRAVVLFAAALADVAQRGSDLSGGDRSLTPVRR
ncbi:MAG: hypothetical protein ACK5OX_02230 [Desertimonas sp.]